MTYSLQIETDKVPIGVSRAIDYLLEHLYARSAKLRSEIETAEKQGREAAADLEKGNPYLEVVRRLEKELSEIDASLAEVSGKEAV